MAFGTSGGISGGFSTSFSFSFFFIFFIIIAVFFVFGGRRGYVNPKKTNPLRRKSLVIRLFPFMVVMMVSEREWD